MLKNLIEHAARRLGFDIIAKWRIPDLSYTHRLQTLFKHFGVTSIIDIGANAGQFHDQMRNQIGFKGPIYSFEPDPVLAAALADRAATDPNWTIFPVALGASAGMTTFNVMTNPVYNSFRVPDSRQLAHHENGNIVAYTVEVEVRTLDAMAAEFPDLAHTYVKVDTQGFDLEVLKGGQQVARQIPALQTEVSLTPLYLGGPTISESIAAFSEVGLSVADLFLVSTDGQHRAAEFDCVMVRDCRTS